MTLDEFLSSRLRNGIIDPTPDISLYVRKTQRCIYGRMVRTFEIAKVEVTPESRGKGVFTQFLAQVERRSTEEGYDGVFIECIQEPRLIPWLEKQGYKRVSGPEELAPHLYKKTEAPKPKNPFLPKKP